MVWLVWRMSASAGLLSRDRRDEPAERAVVCGFAGAGRAVGRSGGGGGPSPVGEHDPDGGEARPVRGGGAGNGVGGDAFDAADACSSGTPTGAHEMGDLAFDLGASGPVGVLPFRGCLGGLDPLK